MKFKVKIVHAHVQCNISTFDSFVKDNIYGCIRQCLQSIFVKSYQQWVCIYNKHSLRGIKYKYHKALWNLCILQTIHFMTLFNDE